MNLQDPVTLKQGARLTGYTPMRLLQMIKENVIDETKAELVGTTWLVARAALPPRKGKKRKGNGKP